MELRFKHYQTKVLTIDGLWIKWILPITCSGCFADSFPRRNQLSCWVRQECDNDNNLYTLDG